MQAAKDSAMAMAMLTPLGEEKAAADAGKGLWPWLKSLPSKCKNWWKKPSELPKIFGSRGGTTTAEKVAELKNAMLKGEYRFNAPEGQIGGWVNSKGEYMIGEGHHRMQAAIEAAKQSGNSKYIDQLLQNGVWTRVDEFPTLPTSLPPVR
jgi:filamentous hemagglutinin